MGATRYGAEGTVGRGLSPDIWQAYGFIGGDFSDPSRKPFFFDDFDRLGVLATATAQGPYKTLQEGASTITQYGTIDNSQEEFGILALEAFDADTEEASIELGAGSGGMVRLDTTAGSRSVVCWEARIRRTTVLDNQTSFAFGLAEPGLAAAATLADNTAALASKDFIGFQTLAASNEEVDAIFRTAGQALVQVTDNAGTAVAATYQKYGCVFDPMAASGEKMRFFIDGAEISYDTAVTDAVIAGATFPLDESLTLLLAAHNGDAGATNHPLFMDWWAVGSYCIDL
jgi:hypothetical protein